MRKSGVLLPIFSLDGDYGIGSLGQRAYEFADILRLCGQHIWQILPTCPIDHTHSPYQSTSNFAGNTLLIDVELLAETGLLTADEIKPLYVKNQGVIDYESLIPAKKQVIEIACKQFFTRASLDLQYAFRNYCQLHDQYWLHDYALFEVISALQENKPWYEWPQALRDRDAQNLASFAKKHAVDIDYIKIAQFLFDMQWQQFKAYCRQINLEVIGDMPLFIAHNSVDAWCYRSLFYFDHQGKCTVVAGVPHDYLSDTGKHTRQQAGQHIGQRWGNPLYRWQNHQLTQFKWWFDRFDYLLSRVDLLRIKHFRGLQSYWEINANEDNAEKGRWLKAPGEQLLKAYFTYQSYARFIADDLGMMTHEVEALRDQFSLPGMTVLQFAFDGNKDNRHLPANYRENSVAYTSNHDNDTLVGWLNTKANRSQIAEAMNMPQDALNHWSLIYSVMNSAANRSIIPMQDILALPGQARMNNPSIKSDKNWRWRMQLSDFTLETQKILYDLTVQTNRCIPYYSNMY